MSQIIELLAEAEALLKTEAFMECCAAERCEECVTQALTLLTQQPPAGELIAMQNNLGLGHRGDILITTQERVDNNLEPIAKDIFDEAYAMEICRRWNNFDRLDRAEAINKDLVEALEQSKEIYSKKLCSIRERENKAKDNLHFIESRYWGGIYYQIFELRMEIERMLDKKNLNDFCILMAFMPEEKKAAAITKAKKVGG